VSRPPRIRGFDYIGRQRYFLTFCTFRRHKTFHDLSIAAQVLLQFRQDARRSGFAILAYCLMPDHAHLLLEGTTRKADLRRFVKRAKQRTGQMCRRVIGRPLWQEGYYDRVLRTEDDSIAVARYILENPVRAGLVRSPADYPLLGSDVWSLQELLGSI
jgi:REP-associated tyrosine transposase